MNDFDQSERVLQPYTKTLKQQLGELAAPSEIETDLLTAFDNQFPKRTWWSVWGTFQWRVAGGVMASILVAMVFVNTPVTPNVVAIDVPNQIKADLYEDIPFIALNSGEEILKQDSMRIVQAEIPHTLLAAMGVIVNPQVAGNSSRAEMLVGENEEYLAMRFLPN